MQRAEIETSSESGTFYVPRGVRQKQNSVRYRRSAG
jgi:hypothetical protein